MPRFAMKIEYHGGPFAGWQRQKDVPSVQEAVEEALRKLEVDHGGISAAGRTGNAVVLELLQRLEECFAKQWHKQCFCVAAKVG